MKMSNKILFNILAVVILYMNSNGIYADPIALERYINDDVLTADALNSNVNIIESSINGIVTQTQNLATGCTDGAIKSIDAQGAVSCTPIGDTLADLSCGPQQVAKWSGAVWVCADDIDTDTNTDTLGGLNCGNGQVAKWNGTLWICADDVDTDTDTLNGLACINGQVAKWNGSTWACAADVDTDTDTDTLAGLACSAGEVAKWNGSVWVCAADTDVGSAGVAFASSTSDFQLSNTASTIQSVTLTAPGPGLVVVSFSAYYKMLHTNGVVDQMEVGISDSSSAAISGLTSRRFLLLDTGFASGNFYGSVSSNAVFTVGAAGTFIYYVLGVSNKPAATASFYVSHPATQAIFVPNPY